MDNSPRLPVVSLLLAGVFTALTAIAYATRGDHDGPFHLTELEIGLAGAAFSLAIFGVQGLISVLLEGRELHPGIVRPRLTDPLSLAIVVFSLVLFADAILLGYGLISDWGPRAIGTLAGVGCIVLATLLVFYKEAFVGDEACFDEREDGVPW